MIVAPGDELRSVDIAKHLNAEGVEAFVLRYRLTYTDPIQRPVRRLPLRPAGWTNIRQLSGADGQQAVRMRREHAAE
jgi:hypothetical protein